MQAFKCFIFGSSQGAPAMDPEQAGMAGDAAARMSTTFQNRAGARRPYRRLSKFHIQGTKEL